MKLELVGSWTVLVGDMDQALHLWRYTGGFAKVDLANDVLPKDNVRVYFKNVWNLFKVKKFFFPRIFQNYRQKEGHIFEPDIYNIFYNSVIGLK